MIHTILFIIAGCLCCISFPEGYAQGGGLSDPKLRFLQLPANQSQNVGGQQATAIDPISGEWDTTFNFLGKPTQVTLDLKLDGGKISGRVISSQDFPLTVTDGSWDGNKLSLTFRLPENSPLKGEVSPSLKMTGVLQNGNLSGDMEIKLSEGNWQAKKKAAVSSQSSSPLTEKQITAILVNKDGAPLKVRTVIAYPLNADGEALLVATTPPGYTIKVWNPMAKPDDSGKVILVIPSVTQIGKHRISEVAIGVGNPSVRPFYMRNLDFPSIKYTDPKRMAEDCLTDIVGADELSKLSLLRRGAEIIKVKINQGAKEADLGKITVE